METVKVNLKERSYKIIIGTQITRLLGKYLSSLYIGDYAYIITNPFLARRYGKLLCSSLKQFGITAGFKCIADTERCKTLATAESIIRDIISVDRKKMVFIIAFGGGVIGDVAGFAASVYKRGIPYVQIPTTLLAQVDSAIGGKTAVDLPEGKNLVGAFYQPRLVFSDTVFLNTLEAKQLRSGLAEVIKYAVIKNRQLFAYLENTLPEILSVEPHAMEFIIARCSAVKSRIVQRDEREERGLRTILNFGHTLGHALETAGKYRGYTHGEAIAIGMLLACDISLMLGLTEQKTVRRIEELMVKTGLPIRIDRKFKISDIIKAHYYDKKFIGTKNKFVLIQKIGACKVVENIPLPVIHKVLKARLE